MEKRGISQIKGPAEIRLSETAYFEVSRIYDLADEAKVYNAHWSISVREDGAWRELKPKAGTPPKTGAEIPITITNQTLVGKELLIEAYIYAPEKTAPPGLKVKVVAGTVKKITDVELFMIDDTPIKEGTILKYNQTIKVKVYTQNMRWEMLKLSLYEDDAGNEKNKVAEVTKALNKNGFLWHEFKLKADFAKITNAIKDGSYNELHEYYVVVKSVKYGKNAEVSNPDYIVHQTYDSRQIIDHKKANDTGVKEVVVKGKYQKEIGIDPLVYTGNKPVLVDTDPVEKKAELLGISVEWWDAEMLHKIDKAAIGDKVSILVRFFIATLNTTVNVVVEKEDGNGKAVGKDITVSGTVQGMTLAELKGVITVDSAAAYYKIKRVTSMGRTANFDVRLQIDEDCEKKFKKIIPIILKHEGGYDNDPEDSGGATGRGITIGDWKAYAKKDLGIEPTIENLKHITVEQASTIYKKEYWERGCFCKVKNDRVRLMVFDWSITSGGAARQVQKLLVNEFNQSIIVDGAWGCKTSEAINNVEDQEEFLSRIAQIRKDYYTSLCYDKNGEKTKNYKFLKGWKARVDDCLTVNIN